MKSFLLLCLAIVIAIASAHWHAYCTQGGCPDLMLDIIPVDEHSACICGGYTREPLGVFCSSRSNFTQFERIPVTEPSFMFTAFASNPDNNAAVTAGMGYKQLNSSAIHYSHNLREFLPSTLPHPNAFGQDIKPILPPPGQISPHPNRTPFVFTGTTNAGEEGEKQGLLLTVDGGQSFREIPWADGIPYQVRYGAFPSEEVFYATGGTFPSATPQQQLLDNTNRCLRFSEHVCQSVPSTVPSEFIERFNHQVYGFSSSSPLYKATASLFDESIRTNSGYYGVITKYNTTTGVWTKLYETHDIYFNDISCATPLQCIAVGEGLPYAHVFRTDDGGLTWTKTLTIQSELLVSLFRARFVLTENNQTIAFVSGGYFDMEKGSVVGVIYKSLDHGLTWQEDTTIPGVAVVTGMNFEKYGRYGYAVGSTQSNQAIILKYTR